MPAFAGMTDGESALRPAGISRRLLLGGALALSGCSVLPQRPAIRQTQWPLTIPRPAMLPPNPHGPILLVSDLRAAAGLERRGLQTIQPDGSLHVSFYEQWAVPPAEAISSQLRQWIAGSGLFAAVLAPGSRMTADLVLEGELMALQATPSRHVASASLAMVLLDQRAGKDRVRLQQTFTTRAPLAKADATTIVRAERAALAEAFTAIQAALHPFA